MALTDPAAIIADVPLSLSIGGQWTPADSGATFGVEDPATGQIVAQVADGGVAEALRAMDAAAAAQADWAKTAPRARGEILREVWRRMVAEQDRLAALMTLEMGKSVAESKGEVLYAADYFRWFSEEAVRIPGDYLPAPDGASRKLVLRQPVGPCVLVTPWNFPLAMGARKIGPALAAGCTVVVKPAQQTPLSMLAIARLFEEAGLPPGVLNIVTTTQAKETVAAMIDHPAARKISFTGSTPVGRGLAEHAGRRLLRASMELGGDNALIVFDDADMEVALEGTLLAKLRNIGEACTAANRILVHSSLIDSFAARLAERMAAQKVGPGLEGGELGPLIDGKARDKVDGLVQAAIAGGARALIGGAKPEGPGYFYPPTVLIDTPEGAEILRTEIFGPVAVLQAFDTEDEAIASANASEYGLTAYVFTRDLSRALRVIDQLEVGMIGLNRGMVSNPAAPFGGIKASGLGREGGAEGIEEYLSVKYASIAL